MNAIQLLTSVVAEADRRQSELIGRVLHKAEAQPTLYPTIYRCLAVKDYICSFQHCLRELEKRFRKIPSASQAYDWDCPTPRTEYWTDTQEQEDVADQITAIQNDIKTMRLMPCGYCLECLHGQFDPDLLSREIIRIRPRSPAYNGGWELD